MKKLITNILIISLFFFLSCLQNPEHKFDKKDSIKVENSCSNYQHLVSSVNWYNRSGEMRACYYQAYNLAKLQLDKHLKKAIKGRKKAVVFDIDETLINNSPFEIKTIETGKGYSKETWLQWTSLARAAAVPGALDFLIFAKEKGVEIFFITNRRIEEKSVTVKNLDSLKFPYLDDAHILFRTDESSKENRRKIISKDYDILLLIGDNLADFSLIFEDRSDNLGFNIVDQSKENFGDKFIILPNPMYGDWEMALFEKGSKPDDNEKGKILSNGLKSGY